MERQRKQNNDPVSSAATIGHGSGEGRREKQKNNTMDSNVVPHHSSMAQVRAGEKNRRTTPGIPTWTPIVEWTTIVS